MANTSSGFLTKSVIVLSLFLVSMGVSLFLGKAMGKSIMTLARSNIEKRFPSGDKNEGQGGNLSNGPGGSRSAFGFNSGEFAPDEAPRSWAEPERLHFSTVNPEPEVDITLLPDKPKDSETTAGETDSVTGDSSKKPDDGKKSEGSGSDGSIFKLSNTTVYRIQVGTFSSSENAESVWRRLTQAGYDAHMTSFKDADGDRFKVYVGAYHNREDADKVAENLRSMNFDAWVYEER